MGTKVVVPARDRILAFMARVGRPVTSGEVAAYCLTAVPAREVRAVMAGLEAEGRVSAEPRSCPTALGRVAWTYRLNP